MSNPPFGLAPGIHVARIDDRFVVLDRRRDSYSMIAGTAAEALARLFAAGELLPALSPLIAAGILTRGATPLETIITPPAHEFMSVNVPGRSVGQLTAWLSCLSTAVRFAIQPLDRVCAALEGAAPRHHQAELGAALAAFAAGRRWFPKRPSCLFDSLALHRFLLRRGIDARTVFGVRLDPFAAHSWVEVEGAVVNDRLATVHNFTPIMVIGP